MTGCVVCWSGKKEMGLGKVEDDGCMEDGMGGGHRMVFFVKEIVFFFFFLHV
jgi:hypothetical protein